MSSEPQKPPNTSPNPREKEHRPLLSYATPFQQRLVYTLLRYPSIAGAAEELGMSPNAVRARLSDLRQRAARRGWSPGHDMTEPTPAGYHVKGVSTYYRVRPDGTKEPTGQWVKTQKDQEHQVAMLLDAVQTVAEPFKAKSEYVPAPDVEYETDTMCVYPLGDPHLGMHAWGREAGKDFDLKIGEHRLVTCIDKLVDLAPPSELAIVASLGDFFHTDTFRNVTEQSGNPLDVDSRWSKVLAVGIRAFCRIVCAVRRASDPAPSGSRTWRAKRPCRPVSEKTLRGSRGTP